MNARFTAFLPDRSPNTTPNATPNTPSRGAAVILPPEPKPEPLPELKPDLQPDPETALDALLAEVRALRRPRLLIRAARAGLPEYSRSRDLRRLLRQSPPPPPARALAALIEAEARLEAQRRRHEAGYPVARHLELVIALMAEFALMAHDRAPRDDAPRDDARARP